ncbi:MAG: HAD hydrolase family protein [Ruminococcus sp.]|uniref:FUSC family protein n=1 Tax=Ruminococcus sp. TaxID=41978 RepID=UPI0025E94AA5|nr:FUSC family protein [Ruminococcus sp.]MBR5683206.1 HAD hydrolase family protein [Ruminococcus sp.]
MKLTFPPIGARIVKSSIAVGLCMAVYFIRTLLPVGNGIPFYGALAALWCIQPYTDTTKNNALQRSVGTLTGAVYGLLFLLLFRRLGLAIPEFVYISASIFIIPVIYTTVVMNKRNASFFSCVVFLSIALTHSFDENPYLFVLNRVVDTFIGIIIGVAVNDFRLPVRRDDSTLYVSGLDDVLISQASNYSKVELNRLIRSGVKFTISTTRTPAELMSIMQGTDLQLPVIVMDGAALYDVKEKQYLDMTYLSPTVSAEAERIISECGLHCFVNTMLDSTLLIYYGELHNSAEKELFESHKHSPYRNYVRSEYRRKDMNERVLYITVLAEKIDIFLLERKLRQQLGASAKISLSDSEYEGFMYLKVFSPLASKENMMIRLKEYADADKIVTFGSIRGKYDVYINDGGGNATVKKLKKICRAHGHF